MFYYKFIFNSNSLYIFRIISCLFYILSVYVFLKILLLRKKLLNLNYLILSLAPLTLIVIYQSSLARGYSLLLFLFLVCILILLSITKKINFINGYVGQFLLSLFFYKPSLLYTHLAICLIIFIYAEFFKNRNWKLIILIFTYFIFPNNNFSGI